MRISDCFNQEKGHAHFEYIDIDTNKDTTLFIDPCLIEVSKSSFCIDAAKVMKSWLLKEYSHLPQ